MTEHAILSASSAYRWLKCPPCARLELNYPDEPGEAAEEGTFAHSIVEERLRRIIAGKKPGKTSTKLKANSYYKPAMEEHVDTFINYVLEIHNTCLANTPDTLLLSETRLDYSDWVPEGFGTADACIIADGAVHVFDFKYGKGVEVFAEDNPQTRLYGLGAIKEFSALYSVDTLHLHIVQPRRDSTTTEILDVFSLLNWGEDIRPIAEQAFKGEGEFHPGPHCQFCKVVDCRARAAKQLELAQYDFKEAPLLTPEEIGDILGRIDELTKWATGIKAWAFDQALNNNTTFPGWKLVLGRANRKIIDEYLAAQRLEDAGFSREDTMKLQGITILEELVGAKQLSALLAELLVKPEGSPTLVRETDKREAMNRTAEQDFEGVN